ncbi:TPA: hypothetical protein ACKRTE_004150, partial [Providencia rettgeri]
FNGIGFIFHHRIDNLGGMWSIKIDNKAPIIISCHSDNPENKTFIGGNASKVFNGLKKTEHEVEFKFIGRDPNYPPTDNDARGWFKMFSGSDTHTASVIEGSEMGIAEFGNDIVANGIIDFAINATTNLQDKKSTWCPAHGSESGAMHIISKKIMIDGAKIASVDDIKESEISEFVMIQEYVAYNTNDTSKSHPMWSGVLTTKFDKDNGLSFDHELITQNDIFVGDGYTAMCSFRRNFFNVLELDNGLSINITSPLPQGNISHAGGLMTSISYQGGNVSLAMKSNSPASSYCQGSHFNDGSGALITERTDGFVKTYFVAIG